jgi:hypothetical protein
MLTLAHVIVVARLVSLMGLFVATVWMLVVVARERATDRPPAATPPAAPS